MPPKAKSATTSSKSVTSKPGACRTPQDTPLQFVKGVGPRLGAIFASRGFTRSGSCSSFFRAPTRTEASCSRISEAVEGAQVRPSRSRSRACARSRCEAASANPCSKSAAPTRAAPAWAQVVSRARGMEQRFKPGDANDRHGPVKKFMGRPEIMHPEITWGRERRDRQARATVPEPRLHADLAASSPSTSRSKASPAASCAKCSGKRSKSSGVPAERGSSGQVPRAASTCPGSHAAVRSHPFSA